MMVVTRAIVPPAASTSFPAPGFPGGSLTVGGAAGGPSVARPVESFSLACKLLNGTTVSVETTFTERFSEIKRKLAVRVIAAS
jgi:hypothetical protein